MKQIEGDVLDLALNGQFDVIVHGCNCFHAMGAGIAAPISRMFPEALTADKATPYGDRSKLGTISTAKIKRGQAQFVIVNAYTQYDYNGPGPHVDYDAISRCFSIVAEEFPYAQIGYPRIGAGLAGGDWTAISQRIERSLAGLDHTLVILPSQS